MSVIIDEKELGKALKSEQDTIEIEGDLAKKIIRIRATGKVAWAVAIGAIGIAVTSILLAPSTGGASTTVNLFAAPIAVGILGGAATISAITIAVGAGSIGALGALRKYKEISREGNRLVLKRR